jgi:hypothetical protein
MRAVRGDGSVVETEDSPPTCEQGPFRSRSRGRFPCGTRGFGIMTEYLRVGGKSGARGQKRRGAAARRAEGRTGRRVRSRQGCSPTGERPAASIARRGRAGMPLPDGVTTRDETRRPARAAWHVGIVVEAGDSPARREGRPFSSRSLPGFPCGTRGFGITEDYLGVGEKAAELAKFRITAWHRRARTYNQSMNGLEHNSSIKSLRSGTVHP